ncbi:unnamed protein product [Ectocarpus sp. CCAP 1310/34]|nr:unnamed protein product [Ectocarpus sp. CCAP 1310/34]
MASSKPKKGFSMSLGKPKLSSSSATSAKGPDRATSGGSKWSASAIGIAHDDEDAGGRGGKRDYVTGIGGGKVVTKEVVVDRGPRVIALASNPWANGSNAGSVPPPAATAAERLPTEEEPAGEKSLDQLAAEAIAKESVRGDGSSADAFGLGVNSDRVIGMIGKNPAAGEGDSSNGGATATTTPAAAGSKRKTGLLEQNMIPGLMEVDGEDAKFKHDLGHRAEDLSARSKAYVDVPVAEFGAALLRGMGWTGPEGDGGGGGGGGGSGPDLSKDIEPRHHRLGLGAQPKPPEEMKRPRKKKPGEKPRSSDAERLKIWEEKVQEERLRASRPSATAQLAVMDVVELSEAGGEGGRRRPRAMVLKTQGVPGLNKISVRMEDTGEKLLVDKATATRVSEDELARRPFSENKDRSSRSSSGGGKRGRSRSGSRSRSSGNVEREDARRERRENKDKKKHKKSGGSSSSKRERSSDGRRSSPSPRRRPDDEVDRYRRRDGRRDDDDGGRGRRDDIPAEKSRRDDGDSERGRYSDGNAGNGGRQSGPPAWLRANIRVRVIHKSYGGGRAYLGKGRVVDVPRVGQATVRMDLGELVLEGVKERHLETVLPSRGGKVIVVRGAEKGATGKLLAKNKEKETALVQVYEDLRAVTLSLDDVAEYTGMLDEDMEDVGY